MRIAWITDPHFDLASEDLLERVAAEAADRADVVLITGDIGEAASTEDLLYRFKSVFGKRMYFVLGNHDFYGSSIGEVERRMIALDDPDLVYLTGAGVIELSPTFALVGDDGWYDGRYGEIDATRFDMRDWHEIDEIRGSISANPHARSLMLKDKLEWLGDRAVARVQPKLEEALANYKHVIFATHIPPFAGAATYKGRPSSKYTVPFYTNRAMGDMLYGLSTENTDKELTVFCGHCHSYSEYVPDRNLTVYTGAAEYYQPTIMRILHVKDDLRILSLRDPPPTD